MSAIVLQVRQHLAVFSLILATFGSIAFLLTVWPH